MKILVRYILRAVKIVGILCVLVGMGVVCLVGFTLYGPPEIVHSERIEFIQKHMVAIKKNYNVFKTLDDQDLDDFYRNDKIDMGLSEKEIVEFWNKGVVLRRKFYSSLHRNHYYYLIIPVDFDNSFSFIHCDFVL